MSNISKEWKDEAYMNVKKMIASITLCLLLLTSHAIGASLDKAEMFRRHGLVSEAKKELIVLPSEIRATP